MTSKVNNIFVIGNGTSRQQIDLTTLEGITIGCNALHRDFSPTVLCCADERMVVEAKKNKFEGQLYTRTEWADKHNAYPFPPLPYKGDKKFDNPWHWNTGPHAINLAFQLSNGHCTVTLIGFYLVLNKNYTNVYANTPNYNDQPVDPTHWHYQIRKLIELYSDTNFVWYTQKEFVCPKNWSDYANFEVSYIS